VVNLGTIPAILFGRRFHRGVSIDPNKTTETINACPTSTGRGLW
jgi:hypothetical protein